MRLTLALCLTACLAVLAAATPYPELSPLLDGGFEQAVGDRPGTTWTFQAAPGSDARAVIDTKVFHGGRRSVRLSLSRGQTHGQVLGSLQQTVPVAPNTVYRLSLWVRGERAGDHNEVNDPDDLWIDMPAGTFGWTHLTKTLLTKPEQTRLTIMLNLYVPTHAWWVDDLVLAPDHTPLAAKMPGVQGGLRVPDQVEGDNLESTATLLVGMPAAGKARLTVRAGNSARAATVPLAAGLQRIEIPWNTGAPGPTVLDLRLDILDREGRLMATAGRQVKKLSGAPALAALKRIGDDLPGLRRRLEALRARRVAVDYPLVGLTVLEHFVPWAQQDTRRAEVRRAEYAVRDLRQTLARVKEELAALEADPRSAPAVVRYQTGTVAIKGTHFEGSLARSDGSRGTGPLFFTGYGHFSQVRDDLEVFPDYGINVIQIEIGPNSVVQADGSVRMDGIREIEQVLDRAAAANVAVCLLLSPHYFPDWARERWPELNLCRGGFFTYCLDAPQAREIIATFLSTLIPAIKDKPALHSLCLSNEPIYTDTARCPLTHRLWAEWLSREHGDIAKLNARLGTDYPAFDAVPIPGNQDYQAPQFVEWVLFNNERFAGFHQFMADTIHELAPGIPVHAKVMAWTPHGRGDVANGVDAELFGRLSQIGGNDCSYGYPGRGEWAVNWQLQNWFYDLQRTVCRQPVFNTENHLTPDRSTHYVPGAHFRTALWQGAVHGQGATTIWVWERTYDKQSDFYGNVMHRPGCAEETGRVGLDLLRLAPEVAALQQEPVGVAMFHCIASLARSASYQPLMDAVYEGLNFTGVQLGLVTDRMAAAGDFGGAKALVLPAATHVPDEAFAGLERFVQEGGKLLVVGRDNLRFDRFSRERDPARVRALLAGAMVLPEDDARTAAAAGPQQAGAQRRLHARLVEIVDRLGLEPGWRLAGERGQAPWGVEFRTARLGNRRLLNAVNYLKRPRRVMLVADGKPARGRDLISGREVGPTLDLAPLQPVLVEVGRHD